MIVDDEEYEYWLLRKGMEVRIPSMTPTFEFVLRQMHKPSFADAELQARFNGGWLTYNP